jgi:hypothetical protein
VTFTGRGGSNPPSDTQLPVRTAKAPEAILGLRGSRFPRDFPVSSPRSPSDDLGGLGRRLVVGVAVYVRCDRDARVSEPTRHDVQSSTRSERRGGVRMASAVESDRADTRREEHQSFGLAPCRKQALNRPLPANLTGRESGDVFPANQRLDREDHGGRPTQHVRIHLDADAVGRIALSELCLRVERIPIAQVFRPVDDRPFRGRPAM